MADRRYLLLDDLHSALDYDAETGVFHWKIKPNPRGQVAAGDVAGSRDKNGYLTICFHSERYLAHRLAWFYVHGRWPSPEIDHRDRNPSNNAIANLREVTRRGNNWNKSKKVLGYFRVGSKYRAQICINRKCISLGYFNTEDAARQAYSAAHIKHFGCYSPLGVQA